LRLVGADDYSEYTLRRNTRQGHFHQEAPPLTLSFGYAQDRLRCEPHESWVDSILTRDPVETPYMASLPPIRSADQRPLTRI